MRQVLAWTTRRIQRRASAARTLFILVAALNGCQTVNPSVAPKPVVNSAIPARPINRVLDAAGILTRQEAANLAAVLLNLEQRRLGEIAIYIAPALPSGETLEDFTLRVANAWGFGRPGIDDGLVIFVFVADRKIRVEVGDGLSGAVSDEAAARLIAEQMAPSFRRKQYYEGLNLALTELTRLLAEPRG